MTCPSSLAPLLALIIHAGLLGGCGTLIGIPSHGGGKRFATEQRLVSASARAAIKQIDVRPLQGHTAFVLYSVIADQGAGNLSGGRANLGTVLSSAAAINPATRTLNQFQVFDLAASGTNFQNTNGTSSTVAVGTNVTLGTSSGTSTTTSSGTSTDSGTSSGTASTTTTTGSVVTTQTGTSSGTAGNTNTSSGTSSTTSTATSNSTTNSTDTANGTSTANSTGGNTSNYQVVSQQPSGSKQRTGPFSQSAAATLTYKGLGTYDNFPIPVSDVSFFNNLLDTYLKLSGVRTTSRINEADVIVYVLVDVFGTIRSRFDAVIYNSEDLTAETALEVFAFDKRGRLILMPQTSNYEAQYGERYVVWAGPFAVDKGVKQGKGQLVDFKDVRPGRTPRETEVQEKERGVRVPGT